MVSTNASAATVRHVTKNHVTIAPEKGYSVIVFKIVKDGDMEAVIAADDGSETIRLLVAGPSPTQSLNITTGPGGVVDIVYVEKPKAMKEVRESTYDKIRTGGGSNM